MPYQSVDDLPEDLQDLLPKHAKEIYKEAYNSAWDQYADPDDRQSDRSQEETAHAVAWSAVKQDYFKGEDGKWHRKQ